MERRAGVVRIRPDAATIATLARRILSAIARRVVQHLLERRRRVEDLAGGTAVRSLEGSETLRDRGVVVGDVAAHLLELRLVLVGERRGSVESWWEEFDVSFAFQPFAPRPHMRHNRRGEGQDLRGTVNNTNFCTPASNRWFNNSK